MTVRLHPASPQADARSQRGSAVLIVLILLLVMASLVIGNNTTLDHLQRELRFIEERQLRRAAPVSTTNVPAAGLMESSAAPAATNSSTARQPPGE